MEFLAINLLCVAIIGMMALLVYVFTRPKRQYSKIKGEDYTDKTAWRQTYDINLN